MSKNTKLIIFFSICLLIIITIGVSFAYFSVGSISSESTSTINISGGILQITYQNNSGNINIQNAYPRNNEWATKNFTITGTNTTDLKMNYQINLAVDNNTFTEGALSYEFVGSGNGTVVNNSGSISSSGTIELGKGQFLTGENIVHNYTLKIYFKDSGTNQNANQGKSFVAHIGVIDAGTGDLVTMPEKGDLITMDVGEDLPSIYRILKIDGSEALVLAMQDYNVGTTYEFNSNSVTTIFSNGEEGQQYADSSLDILLNTTMYNQMNDEAKDAIIAHDINQNMYSSISVYQQLETTPPYSSDYQSQIFWNDYIWQNLSLVGTVNVGERYIYALDVADIYEYIGRRYINSSELNEIFFNQEYEFETNPTIGNDRLWLRSVEYDQLYVVDGNGGSRSGGTFLFYNYNAKIGVRPAFVIDLSKMGFDFN